MTKPHMTLPNGDVLYEGDYALTRLGHKVGPLRLMGTLSHRWDVPIFDGADGEFFNDSGLSDETSANHLVAKWTDQDDTPVLWKDMSPEQKGALLLARHDGEVIQHTDPSDPDYYWEIWCEPGFDSQTRAYRIKPSKPGPKVETVKRSLHEKKFICYVAIDMIDGEYDMSTVRPWETPDE